MTLIPYYYIVTCFESLSVTPLGGLGLSFRVSHDVDMVIL